MAGEYKRERGQYMGDSHIHVYTHSRSGSQIQLNPRALAMADAWDHATKLRHVFIMHFSLSYCNTNFYIYILFK